MLISSCWNIDIRLFSFYRKIRFGPDQSHYNQSRRWSWLQTTIAQNTRIAPSEYILHWKFFHSSRFLSNLRLARKQSCPGIFHCIEYTFYIQDFWATCACPENRVCPGNFSLYWIYFLHSGFLSNLSLPWKTEFARKIFTALNILFTFRIFEQLSLALKNRVALECFTVFKYFVHSGFLSNSRLPKKKLPRNFSLYLNILYIQDFWATCACLENRVRPGNFHCIEYTFYIQDFWATIVCPENRVALEFFTVFKYFLHSGFLSNSRLPWKTELPRNFSLYLNIFYIQDFWATCACPEKQSLPWKFSLYWIYFLYSGFLSNYRLPWKTELPWNFSLYCIYF